MSVTGNELRAGRGNPQKKGFWRTLFSQYQLMIMSVPMLLYVLLFNYAPIWGWLTAFQDYQPKKGLMGSAWVGLENFKFLFGREDFLLSIRNTLAMSVINLVFGTVSSILQAHRADGHLFAPLPVHGHRGGHGAEYLFQQRRHQFHADVPGFGEGAGVLPGQG